MIGDALPTDPNAMVALIRKIAPDVTAVRDADCPSTILMACGERSSTLRKLKDFERGWAAYGLVFGDEHGLLAALCILVEATCNGSVPGPADIDRLRARATAREDYETALLCTEALSTKSTAAILACARRMPNNDWSKHATCT